MKLYLKPEIETIKIKTTDLIMGIASSPEHGETSAPAREPQQALF